MPELQFSRLPILFLSNELRFIKKENRSSVTHATLILTGLVIMAIVEIKGVVKKVYASSFTVAEKVQIPGYEFEKLYNVWSKDGPTVGSIVSVTGKLSMKIKTYGEGTEQKSFIDVSINEPTINIQKREHATVDEIMDLTTTPN